VQSFGVARVSKRCPRHQPSRFRRGCVPFDAAVHIQAAWILRAAVRSRQDPGRSYLVDASTIRPLPERAQDLLVADVSAGGLARTRGVAEEHTGRFSAERKSFFTKYRLRGGRRRIVDLVSASNRRHPWARGPGVLRGAQPAASHDSGIDQPGTVKPARFDNPGGRPDAAPTSRPPRSASGNGYAHLRHLQRACSGAAVADHGISGAASQALHQRMRLSARRLRFRMPSGLRRAVFCRRGRRAEPRRTAIRPRAETAPVGENAGRRSFCLPTSPPFPARALGVRS